MRPTAVVAAASFIVVLALAGCVRMTIAPSPAAVAPPAVAAVAPPATALEPRAVAAPPVAPHGGAPDLATLRESIWGILVDPAKLAKLGSWKEKHCEHTPDARAPKP